MSIALVSGKTFLSSDQYKTARSLIRKRIYKCHRYFVRQQDTIENGIIYPQKYIVIDITRLDRRGSILGNKTAEEIDVYIGGLQIPPHGLRISTPLLSNDITQIHGITLKQDGYPPNYMNGDWMAKH